MLGDAEVMLSIAGCLSGCALLGGAEAVLSDAEWCSVVLDAFARC